MIGGRVALTVDPGVLEVLTNGRTVVLVSATNGKTTTTRMITAALALTGDVASNSMGANMASGHVATLLDASPDAKAVLEVDERWLPEVLASTRADVVALLNLSHDQLDRTHEVRNIAVEWREALRKTPPKHIIANAEDPLITWVATDLDGVSWVGTGFGTEHDVVGCPECRTKLTFTTQDWFCGQCGLRRPEPDLWLEGNSILTTTPTDDTNVESESNAIGSNAIGSGVIATLDLRLPGQVNNINATMAVAVAAALGVDPARTAEQFRSLDDIAGRYRIAEFAGSKVRLLLAKNPAGWRQAIEMLAPAPQPVIISINAQTGDGKDTSWLWDVPFETLTGRPIVAIGERRSDLAVRLRYAEVDHLLADDFKAAVTLTGASEVDLVANYTAFQTHLKEVADAK